MNYYRSSDRVSMVMPDQFMATLIGIFEQNRWEQML